MVYAVDPALASGCAVELVPQSGVYQDQNCAGDKIYISMAAAYGIDTSAPLAYITAELTGGADISRAIRLESLLILFFHRKWIFSMEEAPLSASPICARGTNAVS